jgi:hypothetical protein
MSNVTVTVPDPLIDPLRRPDRVAYSLGRMLGVDDFSDEQTYHRGRLARALLFLHGSGTIAGLRVRYEPKTDDHDEELVVGAGLAIDIAGRLIEVPRDACLRVQAWWDDYAANRTSDLRSGFRDGKVIADVFIRFIVCERGLTPAFVTGPFDALDAVQASRLRDGYEIKLWVRTEEAPPLPKGRLHDVSAIADLQDAILDGFSDPAQPDPTKATDSHALPADLQALDGRFVWLARLELPAAAGAGTDPPTRTADPVSQPDNRSRLFSYPTGVLARLLSV